MDIREIVRGTIDWDDLEGIGRELVERSDRDAIRIEFLDADNWLSTPLVVDHEWFVKVITPQNALVHAFLTGARNIGAFSTGTPGFFERFEGPLEMGKHELEATRKMREIGVNAPKPVEVFEYGRFGVVVLEYLPEFRTFGELSADCQRKYADDLLCALSRMHDHGLAHGDLREENVLIARGELYFIDATRVSEERMAKARPYDIASALAVLAPEVGPREAVAIALRVYDSDQLLAARRFLDFVNLRPDHEFDASRLKAEIERIATV